MQIQFSTTENCTSPLLSNGFSFEGVNPADPPDETGGGGGTSGEPPEDEDPPAQGQ
jgi:hypothetical protein